MNGSHFPMFIFLRRVDYDEQSDSVAQLSRNTPLLFITISSIDCFPIFTIAEKARNALGQLRANDAVVPCDEQRLLQILTDTHPLALTFDPEIDGQGLIYDTDEIIESLKKKLQ